MKKINFSITIMIIMVFSQMINGQTATINIWNGKVPGAIANADYKQTVDSKDNWTKMRFVTEPSIDVYPAVADKATGAAVIVCPGGGYWGLAIGHEGADIAKWFNNLGITAFVLKYRLPDDAIMKDKSIAPLQDAQQAIRVVRQRATEWKIDPAKIGIMGFSAGGHLAATASTLFDENVYTPTDATSARPDFSILIYPVISMDSAITHQGSRLFLLGKNPDKKTVDRFSNELQVTQKTPPAFMVHSIDDNVVPVQNSINYALAMKQHNVPCELHLYQSGGHGYGLGRGSNTETSWPETCKKWLAMRGLLQ